MKSICLGCGTRFCHNNPMRISRLLVLDVDVSPQILQFSLGFSLTFQVCLPFPVEKMLCYSDYHKKDDIGSGPESIHLKV